MKIASVVKDFDINYRGRTKKMQVGHKYVLSDPNAQDLKASFPDKIEYIRPFDISSYKKYNGETLDNKSIVFWRTGGFGDLLFISSAVKYLKLKYPTCKIIFATSLVFVDVIADNIYIDDLELLPLDLEVLQKTDFHIMFEGLIEQGKPGKMFNAYDLVFGHMKLPIEDNSIKKPHVDLSKDRVRDVEEWFKDLGVTDKDIKIAIQLKSSSPVRNYPLDKMEKLVNILLNLDKRIKIFYLSGPTDKELEKLLPETERTKYIFRENRDFRFTMAAVSKMDLAISVDSVLVHLAAALAIPIIGIYGPFPSKIRMVYYKNAVGIDPRTNCGPCCTHGSYPCERCNSNGESLCFHLIDNERDILPEVKLLLSLSGKI